MKTKRYTIEGNGVTFQIIDNDTDLFSAQGIKTHREAIMELDKLEELA